MAPGRILARGGTRRVALAAGSVVTALALFACVIADPPAELPAPVLHHPTIVHGSVFPPTPVLNTWPATFAIPVELLDPTQFFNYAMFVDYDRIGNAGFNTSGSSAPGSDNARFRVVTFTPGKAPDSTECHVVEFLVAVSFINEHTPDPTTGGGDSVSWLYNPTPGAGGCPYYDAGQFADAGGGDGSGSPSDGNPNPVPTD